MQALAHLNIRWHETATSLLLPSLPPSQRTQHTGPDLAHSSPQYCSIVQSYLFSHARDTGISAEFVDIQLRKGNVRVFIW